MTDVNAIINKEIHRTASTSHKKTKGKRAFVVDWREREARTVRMLTMIIKENVRIVDVVKIEIHGTASTSQRKAKGKKR